MRIVLLAAVASLLATSVPMLAKDQSVISLPRVSKWEMNYDIDSCHLMARFGSGNQDVILNITREQPGDAFDALLFGKMFKYDELDMPIELDFGLGGKVIKRSGIALTAGGPDAVPALRVSNLRLDGWAAKSKDEQPPALAQSVETSVTTITFRAASSKRYRLETGSLGPPLAAMRQCTASLIKSWGYDPAVEAGLVRRATPTGNPAAWVVTGDFPSKALWAGHNGLVHFRLDVDETGKPVGCRVLFRTNPDEFADRSCKALLQRAKFNPARDAQGKPVKSFYINSIRWMAGAY